MNASALEQLKEALSALDNLPEGVPDDFEMVYAELEGEVGGQSVLALYENGEWSLTLGGEDDEKDNKDDKGGDSEPEGDSESEDDSEGESEGGEDDESESDSV